MIKKSTDDGMPTASKLFASVNTPYRRIARLYPALVALGPLLPMVLMLGAPLRGWTAALPFAGATILLASLAVALSQLASAAGNRLQSKIYPRWPHDSPTNLRLRPSDTSSSAQQKARWYAAILRLTGIDIEAVRDNPEEAERAINDALVTLRARTFHRHPSATRLDMHNADYGFVRNLAGLKPAWLLASVISCAVCWGIYLLFAEQSPVLPTLSSVVLVGCFLATFVLDDQVRHAARHYADSFFGTLETVDELTRTQGRKKGAS